jgi:hypothetical protein
MDSTPPRVLCVLDPKHRRQSKEILTGTVLDWPRVALEPELAQVLLASRATTLSIHREKNLEEEDIQPEFGRYVHIHEWVCAFP